MNFTFSYWIQSRGLSLNVSLAFGIDYTSYRYLSFCFSFCLYSYRFLSPIYYYGFLSNALAVSSIDPLFHSIVV